MAATLITEPQEFNLIRNPIYITLESDQFTGSAGAYVPAQSNLSCHLEVWQVDAGGDILLSTLKGPYSTIDKRITFDIAKLIPRTQALPSVASIAVEATPLYDEAVGLTSQFYLKYADQFGDPVVVEALTTSDTYLAIYGGLPADAVQDINWLGYGIGLHTYLYRRSSAYTFLKPVSPEQPDWMYFVSLVTGDITVTVTIHYTDGTTSNYDALTMTVDANKAYWLQSGYDQLHVDDNVTSGKTASGYDVSLIYSASNFFTVFHILDQICSPWERVLLMYNGFGGYESVRFRGPVRHLDRVNRETFIRTRWTDFNIDTGDTDDYRTEGSAVVVANTGHYPRWYIEHLRQLIRGKLWVVDTLEERFKRIRCETNQLDLYDESAPPHQIEITYSHAWTDDGFNIY